MSKPGTEAAARPRTLDPTEAAEVLKALSNPNRLRIFLLVRDATMSDPERGGICVGDIAQDLDISQSTVSHHLKDLQHAGLIELDRQGKNVFCSIVCGALTDVVSYLECGELPT
jgi:DNA-binding transcriptional ArsR family regulator